MLAVDGAEEGTGDGDVEEGQHDENNGKHVVTEEDVHLGIDVAA